MEVKVNWRLCDERISDPSRGHEVICVPLTSDANQTFNSCPLGADGSVNLKEINLDEPSKQVLTSNKAKVEEFGKRVGRIHACGLPGPGSQSSCGVVFAVAPGLLLACRHTSVLQRPPNTRAISSAFQSFYRNEMTTPATINELPIDTTYLDNLAKLDRDPMSEQHDDFIDFDVALFVAPGVTWPPLFPDVLLPQEGAKIAAIHYPGDPDGTIPSIPHPSGSAHLTKQTTYAELLRVFRVIGQKNISVGTRLTATHHPSDKVMAYDLALHSGSSGAPLFRFDAPDNTFCGVHIGGEYYQDQHWLRGWNHCGYTVLNPHFVLMYLRYVVPLWVDVPIEVRTYVRAQHSIINAHREWLSNGVSVEMLLSL